MTTVLVALLSLKEAVILLSITSYLLKISCHIKTFNIEERTESHHFPVSISILSTFDKPVQAFSVREEREKRFYRFNSANTEAYKENLTNLLTNEFILNITQTIQDYSIVISVVLDRFLDIFYQCWFCCICVRKSFSRFGLMNVERL